MPISFRRIPYVTITTILWLVLCFYFERATKAFLHPSLLFTWFGVARSSLLDGHFLRFATANFFHVNFGHFISNTIGLIFFIYFLECTAGAYRTLVIILAGALGGTIGSVAFQWVQVMVGASTILFGVYGALGALIFKYRLALARYYRLIAAIWVIQLIFLVIAGYISLKIVDQGAHIGGFIAGILATVALTHHHSLEELQKPVSLQIKIASCALVLFFGAGFIKEVFVFWPTVFS